MFGSYFEAIHISDGMTGKFVHPRKIVSYGCDGQATIEFETNSRIITGYKVKSGNRIIEWIRYGQFHRAYTELNGRKISKPVILRFHPKTRKSLQGIQERYDQRLFGHAGKCRTMYSRGRMLWQEFRYENRHLAYRFSHTDKEVTLKYPNGTIAGIVRCPGGFSTLCGKLDYGKGVKRTPDGEMFFDFHQPETMDDISGFEFSKYGNSWISFRNRKGEIWIQGEYKGRQRVGEWVLNGIHCYYINGVPVEKKLWNTPPEKININSVLRIKNAQMRMALMSRVGMERFARECKHKVVHEDKKRGNKLIQLPIEVSHGIGNGDKKSFMRILIVTCTSTRQKYYLTVPDYIAPKGKRIYLNTCEDARQWTFGVEDPRKKIKFAKES